jgi:hypothetical protein
VPRPHYAALLDRLQAPTWRRWRPRSLGTRPRQGVAFGEGAGPGSFEVDLVPRVLTAGEWRALAAGLEQRVRALNAFLLDAYGERRIVAAGVVDEAVIDEAEGYEPDLRGRLPAGSAPAALAGLDVVRDPAGRFFVLEDNLRTPSGFAYAAAAREAVDAVLGELAGGLQDFAGPVRDALVEVLRSAAPAGAASDPCVVVLSDGPGASSWWEHSEVAGWLGVPAVTLADLQTRDGRVWVRGPGGRRRPVDVVYRRCNEDRLRDGDGRLTPPAELLLEPWLAGTVAVVNAFGTGLGDDKLVHAHVDGMIRFYLGEEPLVDSVPAADLADPAALEAGPGGSAPVRRQAAPRRGRRGRGGVRARRRGRPRALGRRAARARRGLHRAVHDPPVAPPHRAWRRPGAAPRGPAALRRLDRLHDPRPARRADAGRAGRGRAGRQLPPERRCQGHMGAELKPIRDLGAWSRWRTSEAYTLGVEEEVMLLAPPGGGLAQRGDDVLPELAEPLAGRVSGETHQAALELTCAPHETVAGGRGGARGSAQPPPRFAGGAGPRRRRRRRAPVHPRVGDRGLACRPLPAHPAHHARAGAP